MTKKIAVITNSIPYYRFDAFHSLQKREDISFRYFLSLPLDKSCSDAQQSLDLHFSKGLNINYKSIHTNTKTEQVELLNLPFNLFFDILSYKPDLIISGEMGPKSFLSFIASLLLRVPFVIWSEEILLTSFNISLFQRVLRKILFKYSNAFLAWGSPSFEYISKNGIHPNKIYRCAQSVDNDYWRLKVDEYDKNSLKMKTNSVGRVFILTGRLVKRKGFDKFLQAWSALPATLKSNNSIIIAGAGEEEDYLFKLAVELSIPNINFLGAVSQADLPMYYALADVFVFPSLVDVWGLVVNEALAAGLPVLGSKYAGSSQELILNNDIGELIDPLDIEDFTIKLSDWCNKDLSKYKEKTRGVVQAINSSVTIDGFDALISDLI